jgi:hypothetical protein
VEAEPTEDETATAMGGLGGGNVVGCCCWIIARTKRDDGVTWPSISEAGFWFSRLPESADGKVTLKDRFQVVPARLVTAMAP